MSRRRTTSRHASRILAALAVGVLILAGCGSSSGSSSPSTASTSTASTATTENLNALGSPNPATGTPITVGLMTDGGSGSLDTQSALTEQGARIAVSYVNDYTGGVAGHPIELLVCANQATPAGAQSCANQFIEKKVVAALWPYTSQGAVVPLLTGAGIPVITLSGASVQELTSPGVFTLTGGFPGTLGAFALDAKAHGYKKFAMVVIDVPAATQGIDFLGKPAFKKAGVQIESIPAAPGTPDLTPQLQKAVSDGADAVGVTGDVTFCTSFLKAYDTLSLKLPKYIISVCNDPTVVKALPNALEGARVATSIAQSGHDNDVFSAMIEKYAAGKGIDPDPTKSNGVASGVATIMDFVAGMKGFTGEVTPAAVRKQFETTTGDLFMAGGITFTCNGTALPALKAVCSVAAQLTVLNGNGTTKSTTKVDPAPLFQP